MNKKQKSIPKGFNKCSKDLKSLKNKRINGRMKKHYLRKRKLNFYYEKAKKIMNKVVMKVILNKEMIQNIQKQKHLLSYYKKHKMKIMN